MVFKHTHYSFGFGICYIPLVSIRSNFREFIVFVARSISGLFNGPAVERIRTSAFEKVVVCNTVPLPVEKQMDRIEQLSIAEMLAQAIARIHSKKSVSELFDVKTMRCTEDHQKAVERQTNTL